MAAQVSELLLQEVPPNEFWNQKWLKNWLHHCITSAPQISDLAKSLGWHQDMRYYLREQNHAFSVQHLVNGVFQVVCLQSFRRRSKIKRNKARFQAWLKTLSIEDKIAALLERVQFGDEPSCLCWGFETINFNHLELMQAVNKLIRYDEPAIKPGDYALLVRPDDLDKDEDYELILPDCGGFICYGSGGQVVNITNHQDWTKCQP